MSASTGSSSPTQPPCYAMPAASYPVPPGRHTSHLRLFVLLGIALAVVIAVVVLVAWLVTPPTTPVPPTCKHPGCGRPPTGNPVGPLRPAPGHQLLPSASGGNANYGPAQAHPLVAQPVQTLPRFTAPDGSWSVAYPPGIGAIPPGAKDLELETRDGGKIQYFGAPAPNQTARDIVQNLIQQNWPGATLAYQVPNAMVGYQPGYGEFDDFTLQSGAASYTQGRALAIVAIKNGFALGVLAVGPYRQFKPGDPGNHPSAANLMEAMASAPWLNTFRWKGDPPR